MEGLTAVYALGSIALIVIGSAMILRKAFSSNIWWGLGCVLLSFITTVFVFWQWRDARKAFLILLTGADIWGGAFLQPRKRATRS